MWFCCNNTSGVDAVESVVVVDSKPSSLSNLGLSIHPSNGCEETGMFCCGTTNTNKVDAVEAVEVAPWNEGAFVFSSRVEDTLAAPLAMEPSSSPATELPVATPATELPADTNAEPPDPDAPLRFQFELIRETVTTSWGVELLAVSDNALLIESVKVGGACAESNKNATSAEHKLRAGCVITALGSEKEDGFSVCQTKAEMMQELKSQTRLTAAVIRYPSFMAHLVKSDPSEPLAFDIHASRGHLVVGAIDPGDNPINRWNHANSEKPIVKSDRLVSVNGKMTEEEIVQELQHAPKLDLYVKRVPY
jgi:hypothetical protein